MPSFRLNITHRSLGKCNFGGRVMFNIVWKEPNVTGFRMLSLGFTAATVKRAVEIDE